MDFFELYKLVEFRKYNEFHEKLEENKETLTSYQENVLNISLWIKTGKFDKAKELIETMLDPDSGLKESQRLTLKVKLFSFLHLIGENKWSTDLMHEIEEHYKEYLSETDFEKMIRSDFYNYRGILFILIGKMEQSRKSFQKAIAIDQNIGIPIRVAKIKINQAVGELYSGNLTAALTLLFEAKSTQEELGELHGLAQTYGNISEIMEFKGDWTAAYSYNVMAQEIFEKFNSPEELASNLINQARLVSKHSNFATTNQLYQKALTIREINEENTYPIYQAQALLEYLIFLLKEDRDPNAEFDKLRQFAEKHANNEGIQYRFEFGKALIDFYSQDMTKKINARNEFERIANETHETDYLLYRFVIRYLLDMLLLDYKITQSAETMRDLRLHQQQLHQTASKNNNPELLIASEILQVQIDVYLEEMKQAYSRTMELLEHTYSKDIKHLSQVVDKIFQRLGYLQDNRDQTHISKEVIPSFSGLFDQNEQVQETKIPTIFNLFILTQGYQKIDLFGEGDREKYILPFVNLISLPTNLFVRHFSDKTLLILKNYSPWIGVVYTGNTSMVLERLWILADLFRLKLKFEHLDISTLQYLQSDEVISFVDNYIREEFNTEDIDLRFDINESGKLQEFDLLLHHIRLSIMHVLARQFKLLRSELQEIIGGNRSTFVLNLKKLNKAGMIDEETQFVENRPRKIVFITSQGLKQYNNLKRVIS